MPIDADVVIVGGGFSGLAAAYELSKRGVGVCVFEADAVVGGLAASFDVGNNKLERFYHHWFTSDRDVMGLIDELGLSNRVEINPTNTGMYYARNLFKLSTPMDLLRFTALGWFDRVRLGALSLRARWVRNWQTLESQTAGEWLRALGGERVYNVVWEPLLRGKFGAYADRISAVWIWNKLKLRGGSRGRGGAERLAYFKGGFAALTEVLVDRIRSSGGRIELNTPVSNIRPGHDCWHVTTGRGITKAHRVVLTPALPLIADMLRSWASEDYLRSLERIHYLGNVCLVLQLDRALSDTYWLNVNDPAFPFVGVIEHTNFERPESYGGAHIVYLSRYLPTTDRLYSMDADEFLEYAIPFLMAMFPLLQRSWIRAHHIWRARWSQPVVERNFSKMIPAEDGPKFGLHICSMAQIYPEDRGTNYAIRNGRRLGARLATLLRIEGH